MPGLAGSPTACTTVSPMPARAVLDTNVLVSGLISPSGPPSQVVDLWLGGGYILVTSLYLVEELTHVLAYPRIRARLRLKDDEIEVLLAALLSEAEIVPGRLSLPGVTRDPKDDPVVACAVESAAEYIVSGDDDLLTLHPYQGISIVTPRRFVQIVTCRIANTSGAC
jgi:putative PIN family toxin of toxin-antitoxin system